jgi:hypothetical protein
VKKSLLALALVAGGCVAGPGPLHHRVDTYWNEQYVEAPAVTAVLSSVIPVYPIVYWVAWIPDAVVLNTVQWWGYDLWDGKGAGYKYENVPEDKLKKGWWEK